MNGSRKIPLVIFPLVLLATDVQAALPTVTAGGSLTVGSRDYEGLVVFGQADWAIRDWSPYFRTEVAADSYVDSLALRDSGMGWGQIAQKYGFKLGHVKGRVREAKHICHGEAHGHKHEPGKGNHNSHGHHGEHGGGKP